MRSTRTIVSLSEEDKNWLQKYSKRKGVSMAEAIRKGVSRLRDAERSSLYHIALESTRGIWTKGDGLEYQEKMRKEWK
jgi:hypothetical protein